MGIKHVMVYTCNGNFHRRLKKLNLVLSVPKESTETRHPSDLKTWVRLSSHRLAHLPTILLTCILGISRSSRHKRSASGAQRAHYRKKRKFELGRQPANTKLGAKRIHTVRVRGGNLKFRALRLDGGNFAWGSEHVTKKTRIISVVSYCFQFI